MKTVIALLLAAILVFLVYSRISDHNLKEEAAETAYQARHLIVRKCQALQYKVLSKAGKGYPVSMQLEEEESNYYEAHCREVLQ